MDERSLWYIKRVSAEDYKMIVPDCAVFFNEPAFIELNKEKVEDVFYLIIMRENSARFGIVCGKDNDEMRMPFSAPYSYPVSILSESKQETIDIALRVFEDYCIEQGIEHIHLIFPPLFYDEHLLSGWVSSLFRNGYFVANLDVNYAIDLEKMNVNEAVYQQMIPNKGRKGLRKAQKARLEIIRCETEAEYKEAYQTIKIGHESKGFPVRLSFEQLMDTLKLVEHDVFIVKKDNVGIVAEVLYRINEKIVQGIYTGTHPDYLNCNGMNFLTYYTIKYYGDLGYKILDKAIASVDSVPNYGLCNFKENVGCERSLKYSFRKDL